MNIRPKYILFAETGIKFSQNNLRGANWRQQVFENYRQHLLDQLSKYGEARDYGDWLNEMQSRHANLYKLAGDNWENVAYKNDLVGQYQQDYKGGLGNDGQYKRYGSVALNPEDKYDFNQGISVNYNTRYNISDPPTRTSKDRLGTFRVDNLYSAITDDRRLLGREGDWDETSLNEWNNQLKSKGWEMYLDKNDNYYKLRRLPIGDTDQPLDPNSTGTIENGEVVITGTNRSKQTPASTTTSTPVPTAHNDRYGFDWDKIRGAAQKLFNNPDLWEVGRLIGNLKNNERVYDEQLKGINPELRQTYYTHRQVVGDEATKQGFYRRATQGETKAAQPFTSDADRQMAYQYEAKRIGDELRAQGDLADNQEIRRTSDESNQHQWANTQRATEVANANIASMNQANALRHNLLAQKHSAQWSSIDNYLKSIEYRKRQKLAEDQAIEDQLWTLGQEDIQYTPEYANAYKRYNDILEKHKKADNTYDYYDPEVIAARGEFQNFIKEQKKKQLLDYQEYRRKRNLINYSLSAKSGGKITHKRKDDLLYKSTRDVVEHFRKMSKISSDAQNRRKSKIERLAPHPTKKYQQGGVAPFTVFTPISLGGETTRTQEYDSTSRGSKSAASEKSSQAHDLLKELFKSLAVEGLPSDVNGIYAALNNLMARQKAFGNELSTEDIASMYIQQMQQINNIKYFKAQFDKAQTIVNTKDAESEFAIDTYGRLAVQDKETGKITYKTWDEVKNSDKYNPLKNSDLLNLRAISPTFAYDTDIITTASNATSMSEISKFLKAQLPSIGTSEQTIEGYTKQDSNNIKAGLQLLKDAPAGDYKFTQYNKDQQKQAQMALGYLKGILPKNMKTLLKVNSELQGMSEDSLIKLMIGSELDEDSKLEFTAVTGKAAKDTNGGSGKGGTDTPASVQFLLGNGYSEVVEFNIGNSQSIKALGRFGILQDKEKNNLGQGSNFQDVSKSQFGPILDLDKATFGGSRLNSSGYSHIILNNSDCIGLDLPVKRDISGNYVPDFQKLSLIEKAEEQIRNNKITNPQQINEIYRNLGLPDKFDSNGNIISQNYKRFAGIQVILDSKALKGGAPVNVNEISEADDTERELFIEAMKKDGNKDYDLSDGFLWSSWGRDKLYKGTIFVPVREDIVAGYISGGYPLDTDLPNNANQVAIMQHAPKTQQYQKTPPLSSLK